MLPNKEFFEKNIAIPLLFKKKVVTLQPQIMGKRI